jgi:hypothetical protein
MEFDSDVMKDLTSRRDMKAFVPMGCYEDAGAFTSSSVGSIE